MIARESARRRTWATLLALAEPGDLGLHQMVERLGPEAALAAIEAAGPAQDRTLPPEHTAGESAARPDGSSRRGQEPRPADYRARLPLADGERDLERAAQAAARLVCPEDAEWPDWLDVLVEAGEVSGRGGRPLALWARGSGDLREITTRSAAIVGARSASQYGQYVASELAAGLSDRAITVVSGAAFGIDASAHRGALAASGPTVAVLACGVDVAYPRAHAALLDRIVTEGGLILSEAPPGANPTRPRFLVRNRLIAALTQGTVVVEAALRSGALNTAGWATRCQREVMGVPGPVTSAESAGVHRLLRDGGAVLVTDAAEIAEQIGRMGEDLAPVKQGEERSRDRLDARSLRVLEAVPVRAACPVEPIASATGLPVAEALSVLGRLWVLDYVERPAGGWRLSAAERERCRHPTSTPRIDPAPA